MNTVPQPSHRRFKIANVADLVAQAGAVGARIPVTTDFSVLRSQLAVAGRKTPNRLAVQPMEGFDAEPDGSPGPLSYRRYGRYAAGGFGLIWFEATAVLQEARSNPRQFHLNGKNVGAYAKLVAHTRKSARDAFGREPVLIVQLTHSGRYSKPEGKPRPLIAHRSPVLDPAHNLGLDYPAVTDDYLDRLQEVFENAARLAAQAGFDGVDIKSCHRYLVSELLASFTRTGRYGGSFENRTRLLLESAARIADAVPGIFVTTRMNAYDAIPYPYGFGVDKADPAVPDLAEPIELARRLKSLGAPILNVSIGNPYFNPHYGRPFDFPTQGMIVPDEHPLNAISRFLDITRRFQQELPDLPIVGTGYSWLRQFVPNVAAAVVRDGGAALAGIGRGAFAYPDMPRDILEKGRLDPDKCCVSCSGCTQIMRDGGMTGCVVRDKEIYGAQYRLGRRFSMDRLREEAKRCRDCDHATCVSACPAHVNVPAFVKAFAEGDIAAAYAILRETNPLPEMCAHVCPSETQCEGACLEEIFCRKPIPIRDIQLTVCRIAREMDITGVRLPERASGRKVAVVGGGPAGMACAIRLLERGFAVTIYERSGRLGGVPDEIVPAERYRAATEEIDAILKPALAAGALTLRTGAILGRDIRLKEIMTEFDAVLIALGLGKAAALGKPQEGVLDALDFLRAAKSGKMKNLPAKVAVLGGGNTAMDAAVAAKEMGATDVYLVYRRSFAEMPAWPGEINRLMKSGCHVLALTQPVGYVTGAAGRMTGVRIMRTELGEPDESGRRRPMPVPGSESVLAVGMAIEAIGQTVPEETRDALRGVEFLPDGLVKTAGPDSFATSLPGVFAAGDIINGGTTAVRGIAEGVAAAGEIERFLT